MTTKAALAQEVVDEVFDSTTLFFLFALVTVILLAQLNCWIEKERNRKNS